MCIETVIRVFAIHPWPRAFFASPQSGKSFRRLNLNDKRPITSGSFWPGARNACDLNSNGPIAKNYRRGTKNKSNHKGKCYGKRKDCSSERIYYVLRCSNFFEVMHSAMIGIALVFLFLIFHRIRKMNVCKKCLKSILFHINFKWNMFYFPTIESNFFFKLWVYEIFSFLHILHIFIKHYF